MLIVGPIDQDVLSTLSKSVVTIEGSRIELMDGTALVIDQRPNSGDRLRVTDAIYLAEGVAGFDIRKASVIEGETDHRGGRLDPQHPVDDPRRDVDRSGFVPQAW